MKFKTCAIFVIIQITINKMATAKLKTERSLDKEYKQLDEHTMVTSSNVFPYAAAILKRSTYLSAGALIDENWVLTAADSLFLTRETLKTLRVRLGSINYKKGGLVLPIKFFQIHPYFDDKRPEFDIALLMLPEPVRFTPSLSAIRLQITPREVTATHFIVTSWFAAVNKHFKNSNHTESMEAIERRRILSVTHLHPSDPEVCDEELQELGINRTDTIMCLDPAVKTNACSRDVGAPVILNGVLWGIVSSWRPADCEDVSVGPSFVTLVSAANISSWIHATVHGHRWSNKHNTID